jgi:hypothetical protein
MEPEVSLPYSQEHAIGPYPESDASSPYLPTLFPWHPFWLYPPIYAYVFKVIPSLQVFLPTFCIWEQIIRRKGPKRHELSGKMSDKQ